MATTPPTGWNQAEIDEFFNDMLAKANAAKADYMNIHTPSYLQPYLTEFMAAQPAPPGPGQGVVTNNQVVPLEDNFTNVLGTVTLVVAGGVLQKVKQALNANLAMINNGGNVVVQNAAGVPVAGSPGAAQVAGSNLTAVKLTV